MLIMIKMMIMLINGQLIHKNTFNNLKILIKNNYDHGHDDDHENRNGNNNQTIDNSHCRTVLSTKSKSLSILIMSNDHVHKDNHEEGKNNNNDNQTIHESAFNNLKILVEIDLSYNNVTKFGTRTFR